MRLVKANGEVVDRVYDRPLTLSEIQGYVGGYFEILANRVRIDGQWHVVCVWEEAFLSPVPNDKATKMVGRVLLGDVLFLLDGKEIN